MANLTKPTKPYTQWQAPKPADYPVYRHNGTDYRIVPESALTKLLSDKDGLFWIAIGMATVAIAAVTNVVVNSLTPTAVTANQPPMIIEKPVVVTQEKVVPTNCLAFCNR